MSRTLVTITPADHGRRMTLDEFDRAAGAEGHRYELARGVVTVVEVPGPRHLAQVNAARRQLAGYDLAHAGEIHTIAGGGECKIPVAGLESERHPDLALYKSQPLAEEDVWSVWVPELVVEVVSPGSEDRDYVEKREEYLRFGVQEYWIIDAPKREMLVLRRSRGRWREHAVRGGETYRCSLLPGLEFAVDRVFQAAEQIE